jgi:hypothetical protein
MAGMLPESLGPFFFHCQKMAMQPALTGNCSEKDRMVEGAAVFEDLKKVMSGIDGRDGMGRF